MKKSGMGLWLTVARIWSEVLVNKAANSMNIYIYPFSPPLLPNIKIAEDSTVRITYNVYAVSKESPLVPGPKGDLPPPLDSEKEPKVVGLLRPFDSIVLLKSV